MRRVALAIAAAATLLGQGGPYQRQQVDPAAAARGRTIYAQYCINCHGALAKGTEDGPDLIRSALVLRDRLGNELTPALRSLPDHKRDLTGYQVVDLTHFLKEQVEKTAVNRNPERPPNVLTGNAEIGRAFFQMKCASCHSVTGDLAGIGRRFQSPVDLQQRTLFPRRTKPVRVTVTPTGSAALTGDLVRIDDFSVALKDVAGQYQSWDRSASLKVELHDPLETHIALLDQYTDQNMHDIVRYLESVK